jgi:NAD(P)-dependent dehydrogenase (short-subunit alcohol dehydrogenase family)
MKTAVITGGNGGVGKAVAKALASKGFRVIIHGRQTQKTISAAEEIKKTSGNEQVDYVVADISTIKGMKKLADGIRQKTTSIEVLVLSTGVILPKHILTEDELEAGFAIQYLARFAMTQMLKQELKNGQARIVLVGAPKLRNAHIYLDNLALKNNFSMLRAMGQEMYANHLFVQEFAKLHAHDGILINMAHVGIANTGIMRQANFLMRMAIKLVGKSPEEVAGNFVYLATDPSVDFSGYFLGKPGKPEEKEKIAYDEALAEKLWNKSLDLLYFQPVSDKAQQ